MYVHVIVHCYQLLSGACEYGTSIIMSLQLVHSVNWNSIECIIICTNKVLYGKWTLALIYFTLRHSFLIWIANQLTHYPIRPHYE